MTHERSIVHYMGVRIDNINYQDIRDTVVCTLRHNGRGYICVNDVGNLIEAAKDTMLLNAINSSLMTIADGVPLAWYAKIAGCTRIKRISGMDLMVNMFSENNGYKHYLLGDTESRIRRVMEKAKRINGNINIDGHSPPFTEFDASDNAVMADKLNRARPDIIWVSFGGGKQDKWMCENINRIDRGVMIGVGAAFKWFVGDLKVPPVILQKMGLQWIFRIACSLMEDPVKNLDFVVTRVLKRRLIFVLNFPGEVVRARRACTEKRCGKFQ